MSWFTGLFKPKSTATKGEAGIPKHINLLFDSYGGGIFDNFLSPNLAYKFYHKVGPLQGSIVKITSAISELPLVLQSEESPDDITKDSDVITLLNRPSPNKTKEQFLTDLAVSFLLTREMWVIARGSVNREPLELLAVKPYNVQVVTDTLSDWPASIQVSRGAKLEVFTRHEVKGRFRYFDKLQLNEIFPYIMENDADNFRGVSKLTALKDELLSYSASITGNASSIEQGARPSGVISPEEEIDEEQYDKLTKSFEAFQGAENYGKIMLTPYKVKALFEKWSPKDMDYKTLQDNTKANIWRLYSIPLPIVNEKGQTFSNFRESQTAFYDEAVNQAWCPIADCLKWALSTRYDLEEGRIAYNPLEVPALRLRAIEQMETLGKSGAVTINEIRKSGGYDEVPEGDSVLVPAAQTTLKSIVEGADFDTTVPGDDE